MHYNRQVLPCGKPPLALPIEAHAQREQLGWALSHSVHAVLPLCGLAHARTRQGAKPRARRVHGRRMLPLCARCRPRIFQPLNVMMECVRPRLPERPPL